MNAIQPEYETDFHPPAAKILVVDDEVRARKNMVRWMRAEGYDVYSGISAGDAVELIRDIDFDVVVTDMLMENDNAGIWVLKAAKEKDRLTEVIIITAYGTIPKAVDSTKEGAFDFIEKDAEDINRLLCRKVRESLKRRALMSTERVRRLETGVIEKEVPKTGAFDTMLISHESDKAYADAVAGELRRQGISVWYDKWHLLPEWIFMEEIERILHSFRTVSVLTGEYPHWDDLEIRGFLRLAADRNTPVIPVILPYVKTRPKLPAFFQTRRIVDLRETTPNPYDRYIKVLSEVSFV
jgi:ActR/RegA family two-component response regulator